MLDVIAVGLPRTGTRSLATALDVLGFPCLHEVPSELDFTDVDTGKAEKGEDGFFINASKVLSHTYRAVTDGHRWRGMLAANPDAKVILTTRPVEAWYASIKAHCDAIHTGKRNESAESIEAADTLHAYLFGSRWPLRGTYEARFRQHGEYVRLVCHAENRELLVYDVTLGEWEPLCSFLGVDVPDEPFPWENRSQTPLPEPEPEPEQEDTEVDEAAEVEQVA